MKLSKLLEVEKTLVKAGRTDLAKIIVAKPISPGTIVWAEKVTKELKQAVKERGGKFNEQRFMDAFIRAMYTNVKYPYKKG